jgi:TRAP-type C4-dicarboxylate transport system permease large subunit
MGEALFGIPYFIWSLVCLGLAVLWYFVWPKDRTPEPLKQLPEYKPRPAWMQSVLRWFHALVWALLAVMFLLFGIGQAALASAAGLAAGITYATFVAAVVKDGQRRKALEHESTAPPSDRQSGG